MEQSEERREALDRIDGQERSPAGTDLLILPQQALSAAGDESQGAAQWLGTNSSTLSAIERLKATIDEETEKLELRSLVDFDGFSQRKNRGLLELTRAVRLTQGAEADPRVVAHLTRLRASLVRNQAALQMHLDAVREVSAIIAKSIQDVESDGTYSMTGAGRCK
jgi:hypothetical protein